MNSSRLPGKIMAPICEKPSLWHLLERVKKTEGVDKIIVATTTSIQDEEVDKLCTQEGITCFRGSEEDVLGRYLSCAKKYHLEALIRVTADNPLTDPEGIERLIDAYRSSGAHYIHNKHQVGWPFGTGAELISSEALYHTDKEADQQHYREHVTLFVREHPERFKALKIDAPGYLRRPDYYFTIDYPEDLKLIRIIYHTLYKGNGPFPLHDAVDYLDDNPHLARINAELHQGFSE